MTKHEAFYTGTFIRLSIFHEATTARGDRWRVGLLTYQRYPYERPITEEIVVPARLTLGPPDETA